MLIVYSLLLTLAFIVMSPLFLLRRQKYTAGFSERLLGNPTPDFSKMAANVIWLHCVSVGETNAARPLVDQLIAKFPRSSPRHLDNHQYWSNCWPENVFQGQSRSRFLLPFRLEVQRPTALAAYRPSIVLLMETEIWPRFINEAKKNGQRSP